MDKIDMARFVPMPDFMKPASSKRAEDVPQRPLMRRAAKLYLLGYLAWDYAETCCDIAAQMRVDALKPLCRAVRKLRREYDQFRNPSMRDSSLAKEAELGLLFEELCQKHLNRLNIGLSNDKAVSRLDKEWVTLVNAVQMGMTILDTMSFYDAECGAWLRGYGLGASSMLPGHFHRLALLLPQFAGDRYNHSSESRKITAKILLNELKQIEIYDENGKV